MNKSTHNMIITMAGLGTRFKNAGYDKPKYMIEAKGRTLFDWSMESLKQWFDSSRFHFIVLKQDNARPFITEGCKLAGIQCHNIIELDQMTDGQATSALCAEAELIDPGQSIAIYNIDTFVEPDGLPCEVPADCDGWIPCFPGKGEGWSFVSLDSEGRANEVREKKRISNHATVGFYWFSSYRVYKEIYDDYYSKAQNLEKNEKYIAPMYNWLIDKGKTVRIHEIEMGLVHPLGTPAEVEGFIKKPLEY